MKNLIIAASIAALLSGCIPQAPSAPPGPSRQQLISQYCTKSWADPRLQVIREKIPYAAEQATLQQLSDPSKPTATQQQAISDMENVMAACWQSWVSLARSDLGPSAGDRVETGMAALKMARAELWAKKISFGEYNTKAMDIVIQAKRDAGTLARQQFAAELQAQQESQRNQLMQMQNTQMYLQYLQQLNQSRYRTPTTTNCYRYGNSVNCTSY